MNQSWSLLNAPVITSIHSNCLYQNAVAYVMSILLNAKTFMIGQAALDIVKCTSTK